MSNKKILTKKNITMMTIAASVASVPVVSAASTIMLNNVDTYQISALNNQSFDSAKTVANYIKNNSKKSNRRIENTNSTWSIQYNGKTQKFSKPEDLRNFINKNILEPGRESWVSSLSDLSKYSGAMGELDIDRILNDEDVKLFNKQTSSSLVVSLTKDIFRGNNDKSLNTENEAKESFLKEGSAFYFNDIYFTNKVDLKNYLYNEYLPNHATKYTTIILNGPNNTTSAPINIASKSAKNEIERFIKNNSKIVVDYVNSNTGALTTITEDNLESQLKNVNVKDLDYIHVQSNQGESRYIVDNADAANLIGPYFYKGNLDIGAFKNKKMWRKTNDIKKSVYVESKVDALIGSFFNSVLNDDKALLLREASDEGKIPLLFRTLITKVNKNAVIDEKTGELKDEKMPLDQWFLTELKALSPALFQEVVNTNITLMQGKKYNTFYKIPVLYNLLLQRIVSWGLGQQVLDLVNYYFSEVTDFIQDVLETVIGDKSIFEKKVGDSVKYFNAKEFFQIGNPEYDMNTSVEYFLQEIKTYDKLVAAMWAYNSAYTNLFLTGGLIPYESNDKSYLFENSLISETDFSSIEGTLKKIYTIFSANDYQTMMKEYILKSNDPRIVEISKLDPSLWQEQFEKLNTTNCNIPLSVIIKGIGLKNTEYHDLARAYINSEIRVFNETGRIFNGGYLEQLYNPNPKLDSMANFIIYMNANPNEDSYRVFFAYLFAHKLNGIRLLQGDNVITDKTSFALTVARIISWAFGTAGLVGSSISSVYNNSGFNVRNDNHPIAELSKPTKYKETTWVSENVRNPGIQQRGNVGGDGPTNKPFPSGDNRHSTLRIVEQRTRMPSTKITNPNISLYASKYVWIGDSPIVRTASQTWLEPPLANRRPSSPGNGSIGGGNGSIGGGSTSGSVVDGPLGSNSNLGNISNDNSSIGNLNLEWDTSVNGGVEGGTFDSRYNGIEVDGVRIREGDTFVNINDPLGESSSLASRNFDMDTALDNEFGFLRDDFEEMYAKVDKNRGSSTDWDTNKGTIIGSPSGGDSDMDTPDRPPVTPDDNPDGPNRPSTPDGGVNGSGANSNFDANSLSEDSKRASRKEFDVDDNDGANKNKKKWYQKLLKQKSASDWSGRTVFTKAKDMVVSAVDVIGNYILPIIGSSLMVLEIVTMMIDLFRVTNIKDFYVYTTADGTEFIWDGGLTVSKFLGFDVKQVTGIDSMKLLDPIQITLPQIEEFYYFDKIKYYDIEQMKRASLKYILDNGATANVSSNFTAKYSLLTNNSIIEGTKTIDELVEKVIKDLGLAVKEDGSLDTSNLDQSSIYLNKGLYAFKDGLMATDSSRYDAISKNISENIRETKIIQMPLKNSSGEAISNKEFELAGKVYKNGKITEVTNGYEYLIDNSANLLKEGVTPTIGNMSASDYATENVRDAENNSRKNVKNSYDNKVKIAKKTGVAADVGSKKYSEISSTVTTHTIYNVKTTSGILRFKNLEDAQRYILSQYRFEKHATYTNLTIYNFNGKIMYGDEEVMQYANNLFNEVARL